MKKASALSVVVAFLALVGLGDFGLADTGDTVPINGRANWATRPAGPDFQGVTLIPFEAQNPTRAAWEATQAYLDVAEAFGLDPVQMALRWAADRPFMGSVIFGATSLEQLTRSLGTVDVQLSGEAVDAIEAAHHAHPMPY